MSTNKISVRELEASLFSSLSLSVFLLFSSTTIVNLHKSNILTTNKNEITLIVLVLLLLSIGFAFLGITEFSYVYYSTEDKSDEDTFDFTQSVIYNILVTILIIIEIYISLKIIKSI